MSEANKYIKWELAVKVIEGKASVVETAELEDWIKDKNNRAIWEEIRNIYRASGTDADFNSQKAYKNFQYKNNFPPDGDVFVVPDKMSIFRDKPGKMVLAASFFIALFAIGIMLFFLRSPTWLLPEKKEEWNELKTSHGQYLQIKLTDGTLVRLYPCSKLKHPKKFHKKEHKVYLEGEAYFKVKTDKSKSFIVQSGSIITSVVGTSFKIEEFPNQEHGYVTVLQGKVAVMHIGTKLDFSVINSGQQIVFSKTDNSKVIQTLGNGILSSITEGKMVFNNTSWAEAAKKLERHFGISIHFANKTIEEQHLTATFDNVSLLHLLRILNKLSELKFTQENKKVFISHKVS